MTTAAIAIGPIAVNVDGKIESIITPMSPSPYGVLEPNAPPKHED